MPPGFRGIAPRARPSAFMRRCSSAASVSTPTRRLIDWKAGGAGDDRPARRRLRVFSVPMSRIGAVGPRVFRPPRRDPWSRRAASPSFDSNPGGREEAISWRCAHPAHDRCARWFPSTCRARSSSVSSALLVRWASSRRQAVSVSWATPSPPLALGLLSMPFYVAAGAPSTAGTLKPIRLCLGFESVRALLLRGHGRRPDTALRVQVRRARSEDTGRRLWGDASLRSSTRSFGDGPVRQ